MWHKNNTPRRASSRLRRISPAVAVLSRRRPLLWTCRKCIRSVVFIPRSPDTSSDFSLFEALRETIYSEVATLISQNESRPHFLIELFHELQLLGTDYLRQRALFALQVTPADPAVWPLLVFSPISINEYVKRCGRSVTTIL